MARKVGAEIDLSGESDCDDDDDMGKDVFNTHCGLRTISEKVLQVLLEKRTTTYKQVSDYITNSEAQKLTFYESTFD